MIKGTDCHIHTFYQRCGNSTLTVPNIIARAESLGLEKIAITDHLNNFDKIEAFEYIRRDIEDVKSGIEVFFGVELNYMSRGGEFAYNEQIHRDLGFEVVIGGVHSAYSDSEDHREIIRIQHEHFLKTLENPLLDVLVHPFWFPAPEILKRPPEFWEGLLDAVPDDYVEAWAEASVKHRCAVEVNPKAIFFNPNYSARFKEKYVGLLRRLDRAGAVFAAGSDAHDIGDLGRAYYAEGVLLGMGTPASRVWAPSRKQ